MNGLSRLGTGPGEQYPVRLESEPTGLIKGLLRSGDSLSRSAEAENLLIAYTVFSIASVAVWFWIILCFALYRFYSTKGTDTIPTTRPDGLLSCLDTNDLRHPKIQRPREDGSSDHARRPSEAEARPTPTEST